MKNMKHLEGVFVIVYNIKKLHRNVSNIPEFIRHYQIKTLSNFVHGFITTKMYASHFKSSKLQF